MKIHLLICVISFIHVLPVFASTDKDPIIFQNKLIEPNYGSYFHITQSVTDVDYNTYLTGYCVNDFTDHDIFLLKLDKTGERVFYKQLESFYEKGTRDIPYSIHLDKDNNIYLIGSSTKEYQNTFITKFDASGEIIWTYKHHKENTEFSGVQVGKVDSDGNTYLIASHNGNGNDLVVVSPEGELVRHITLNNIHEFNYQYHIDIENGAIYHYYSGEIYKLNFKGEVVWSYKTLHLHNIEVASLLVNKNDECFLIGQNTAQSSYRIIKLSSSGSVVWDKHLFHNSYYSLFSKAYINKNGDIIAAYANNTASGIGSTQIVLLNDDGDHVQTYDLTSDTGSWIQLNEIVSDEDHNIYISGLDSSDRPLSSSSINRPFIAKFDKLLNFHWKKVIEIKENSHNVPTQIFLSDISNASMIYQTGFSEVSGLRYNTENQSVIATFSDNGQLIKETVFSSPGMSSNNPLSLIKDASGNHYTVTQSINRIKKTTLLICKYSKAGDKLWEYEYEALNNRNANFCKAFALDNDYVKVFINIRGYENGEYIDYHEALTINAEGMLEYFTNFEATSYEFIVSNLNNKHYYLKYWINNDSFISCRQEDDNEVWQIKVNNDPDLNQSIIVGVDKSASLYLLNASKLWKINLQGEKDWVYAIDENQIVKQGLEFDKSDNIIFWFNNKTGDNKLQFHLHKITPDGNLVMKTSNPDILDCIKVWPRNDGSFTIFGEIDSNAFATSMTAMYSVDENGELLSRQDFIFDPYLYGKYGRCTIEIGANNESLYLTTPNKLLKFGDQGKYLGALTIDSFNFSVSNTIYQRIVNIEPNEIIILGSVKSHGNHIYHAWEAGFTMAINTSRLDNQYLTNTPPYFIEHPDTVYITQHFQTQYLYAKDDQCSDLTYSITHDSGGFFWVLPTVGYIYSGYESPPRGIYNLTVRATDLHGAYTEKEIVFFLGTFNDPFIYSQPNTYSRANSYYSYQVIGIDEDFDKLYYRLSENSPSWLSIDTESGLIIGIPPLELENTSVDVQVIVSEPIYSDDVVQSYSLFIDYRNLPPAFTYSPESTANLNETYTFDLSYTDPENDNCMITIKKAPEWLNFNISTQTLTGTPRKGNFYGDNEVIIELSDVYGGVTSLAYRITLKHPGNNPPVFTTDPIIQAYPDMLYQYSILANDPDEDEVSLQLVKIPHFLMFMNKLLVGTPSKSYIGTHEITIEATDYYGAKTILTYNLVVTPVAEIPANFDFSVNESINTLEIQLNNYINASVIIEIVNLKGDKIIEPLSKNVTSENFTVAVDTKNFAKARYIIKVESSEKRHLKYFDIN